MQTTRQIDLTQETHEIIADVAHALMSRGITSTTCAALYTDVDGLLAGVAVGDEEMPKGVTYVACASSTRLIALAARLVADLFAQMEV